MKNAKRWMVLLFAVGLLALVAPGAQGKATVGDVDARQRYPWNGLVDISCKVTGITGEATDIKFIVAAVDGTTGTEQEVSHVRLLKDGSETDDLTVAANGNYELVWDARADFGEGLWNNLVVRVTLNEPPPTPRGVQLWEGGPYWADRNIGAEEPWETGLYFWWGDTVGYRREGDVWVASDGSSVNFKFANSSISGQSCWKDNATLQREGWITTAGVLAPEHDAAQVQWGGGWRMPTDSELSALISNCVWTYSEMNGVKGCVARGKGDFAGASIFLPNTGRGEGTSLRLYETGALRLLWSSVPYAAYSAYAWYLYFPNGMNNNCRRYYGHAIRPVRGSAE